MTEIITLASPRNPVGGVSRAEEVVRRLREAGAWLLDKLVPPGRAAALPPEWFKFPPI